MNISIQFGCPRIFEGNLFTTLWNLFPQAYQGLYHHKGNCQYKIFNFIISIRLYITLITSYLLLLQI